MFSVRILVGVAAISWFAGLAGAGGSAVLNQKYSDMQNNGPLAGERGAAVFPNDECATSESIFSCNSFAFAHTQTGTTNLADPAFTCAFGGATNGAGSNWFRYVAHTDHATIATSYDGQSLPNGRLPDTLLAVYSGSCGALAQIACNDDIDFGSNNFLSRVTITNLNPGQTYYIQVAAFSAEGVASYIVTVSACAAANDECTGAPALGCGTRLLVDLRGGTTSPTDPDFGCPEAGPFPGSHSLWYRFVAASPRVRVFTLDVGGASSQDTLLAMYSGPCGGLTQIACDDDSGLGLLSEMNLDLNVGQEYFIELAAYDDNALGQYVLGIDCRCTFDCGPATVFEAEICGEDSNSGCFTSSSATETTSLGSIICGASKETGSSGDYDIYEFSLPRTAMVYWSVQSDLAMPPGSIALLTTGCPGAPISVNFSDTFACELSQTSIFLSPGMYEGGISIVGVDCDSVGGRYLANATIGPACRGDADGDGEIDFGDITAVLERFTFDYRPFPGIGPGDANFSGNVDFSDITAVLENFGRSCFMSTARPADAAGTPWE